MKHLKEKLIATIAMLLVATVMLTSASFAWFTLSTNPEVSNVQAKVAANGNLEIALSSEENFAKTPDNSSKGDTGYNVKWGNLVDLKQADNLTLKPVEFTDDGLKYPTFGLDGRLDNSSDLTSHWVYISGSQDFGDGGYAQLIDNENYPWAGRIDFFMRTNTAGKILLDTTGTDRGASQTGLGCKVDGDSTNLVRIACQIDGGKLVEIFDGTNWQAEELFTAEKDKVYKVSIYVYLDGADLTNSDLAQELTGINVNVQFKHNENLETIGAKGEEHGRPDP